MNRRGFFGTLAGLFGAAQAPEPKEQPKKTVRTKVFLYATTAAAPQWKCSAEYMEIPMEVRHEETQ